MFPVIVSDDATKLDLVRIAKLISSYYYLIVVGKLYEYKHFPEWEHSVKYVIAHRIMLIFYPSFKVH